MAQEPSGIFFAGSKSIWKPGSQEGELGKQEERKRFLAFDIRHSTFGIPKKGA
jgi:hypothetical protein